MSKLAISMWEWYQCVDCGKMCNVCFLTDSRMFVSRYRECPYCGSKNEIYLWTFNYGDEIMMMEEFSEDCE